MTDPEEQQTLLTQIRMDKLQIQGVLDEMLTIQRSWIDCELITEDEFKGFLSHYRHFLAKFTMIEMMYQLNPDACAVWCANYLGTIVNELPLYIEKVELFNDVDIHERMLVRYPDLKPDLPDTW